MVLKKKKSKQSIDLTVLCRIMNFDCQDKNLTCRKLSDQIGPKYGQKERQGNPTKRNLITF